MTAEAARLLGARARNAIELNHAVAAIGPSIGGFGRGGGAGRGAAPAGRRRPPRMRGLRRRSLRRARSRRRPSPLPRRGAAGAAAAGAGRGGANAQARRLQTVQRLDNKVPPPDHRERRVLRVRVRCRRRQVCRRQGEGRRPDDDPGGRAEGRLDHHQRGRRLHRRPDTPHAQCRRHHRRQRSEAEGHLRPLRRALRSHRLPADAPETAACLAAAPAGRGGGRFGGGNAAGAGGCVGQQRDTPKAGRRHQQRRGRRRIGNGRR